MKQSIFTVILHLSIALCNAQNSSTIQEIPIVIPREFLPDAYCGSDDPVPATPTLNCTVCEGRCGEVKNFIREQFCSCDPACVVYGDCCVDFEQSCPIQFTNSSSFRSLFKHRKTECSLVDVLTDYSTIPEEPPSIIIPEEFSFNFIAICGETGVPCNKTSQDNILKPNLAIPITDPKTGLHYINYECARCNNVTDAIFWIPFVSCDPEKLPPENVTTNDISQELLEMYLPLCFVNYIIPQSVIPRRFCHLFGGERKCPTTCSNTQLIERCENAITSAYIESRSFTMYDNFYCALCAGEIQNNLECARVVFEDLPPAVHIESFSLSLLFDFDPSEGVTVGRKACSAGQRWIPSVRECRQVSCPKDRRLVDGSCLLLSLQFELMISLIFNETHDMDNILMRLELGEFDIETISKELSPLLREGNMDISLNKTAVSESILNISLAFHLKFNRNSTFNFKMDLMNLTGSAHALINNEIILFLQKSGVNLGNVVVIADESVVFKQEFLSDCTWHRFYKGEFEVQNETLLIRASKMVYALNRYSLLESDALVCVLNIDQETDRLNLDVSPVLGILTLILISLSILCLAIRLILQFKVQYFWSFAGKLQFNLFLSLFLAFLMMLLGGVVSIYGPRDVCIVFATLTYWFFLAAFFWMTAVTIDTWITFRPSATFVKAADTKRSMAIYFLPCWLISAGFAIIATALDFASGDSSFKPHFGQRICWFNRRYALLVYFGIPVAILTLLTTIFFIMTVIHVRRTLKSTLKVTSNKTLHQIWIYLRLFSLIGVSWVFGFVAAFVGHDALWIIFIVLNASQGILVFVSFVLNRQVLRDFQKWRKDSSAVGQTAMTSSIEMSDQR